MGYEYNIASSIEILIVVGIIVSVLILIFSCLSSFFIDYNIEKEEREMKRQLAEERDREIITQSKRHTIDCTEYYAMSLRERNKKLDSDFKVDFDINLGGSIVKTEVVYAE